MKKIEQDFEIMSEIDGEKILKDIELYARICYKSEDAITDSSAKKFVANLIKWGHESPLEHKSITVKFITDRGVTHEVIRHRLAAYNQESTRYCNYANDKFGNEISVIPSKSIEENTEAKKAVDKLLAKAEKTYMKLLDMGIKPQDARDVLPTCLKTEIVCTYNLREWRHFFKLRTSKAAHPKIREIATKVLREFQERIPVVFDDIEVEENV